jgi:transposase-like protein
MRKRCPKCGSSRIRHGYARHPLLLRLLGFQELLCDSCNLRFKGFVIPGTLPPSNRNRKKASENEPRRPSRSASEERPRKAEPTMRIGPLHQSKRCPGCEGNNTHRSHRQGITEQLASWLSIYPYRCRECNRRFLARRPNLTGKENLQS